MKKLLFAVFLCLGTMCSHAQVVTTVSLVTVAKVAKAITWGVGTAAKIYNTIPNAEYYVEFKASDGVAYVKVNSANEAILAAAVALENGAEYAHIRSQYPTVHPSCRNKRYTKNDIKYLRERLD